MDYQPGTLRQQCIFRRRIYCTREKYYFSLLGEADMAWDSKSLINRMLASWEMTRRKELFRSSTRCLELSSKISERCRHNYRSRGDWKSAFIIDSMQSDLYVSACDPQRKIATRQAFARAHMHIGYQCRWWFKSALIRQAFKGLKKRIKLDHESVQWACPSTRQFSSPIISPSNQLLPNRFSFTILKISRLLT